MTRDMSTLEVRPDRRSGLPRPWRRHQVDGELAPLLAEFQARHRRADTALIERAFDVARDAHADQRRRSGEPYLGHPLGVAMVVAQLGLDDVTIAAALLHDAVEDTTITTADLEATFGPEVAAIVDGVTKLDRIQFDSREEQQAATLRKMLVAMARDIRVLLIKLADRLHNMQTISSLPESKQRRIARETLDIYAPLAHRLGIQDLKWQLEDLAFAVLHPKRYAEIEQMVAARAPLASRSWSGSCPTCRTGSVTSTSTRRSKAAASTTGRSTRRWSSRARSSTTSRTSSGCGSSSTR